MGQVSDHSALLMRALDLLPYGVVACDDSARLAFGNRMIDEMVGGLRPGQPARSWARAYGLGDTIGAQYRHVEDIPLVAALRRGRVARQRMFQRCGHGSVELLAYTCAVPAADRPHGAVGVFLPVAVSAATRPSDRRAPARLSDVVGQADPLLVAAAIDLAREVTSTAGERTGSLAEQIHDYVHAHQTERIRIADLAREFGYNPTYLTTLLRRRTGEPLTRMILRIRLDSARRLLESTDLPVAAVAARSGPWDTAYFARQFRRRYGCSPTRWRATVHGQRILL